MDDAIGDALAKVAGCIAAGQYRFTVHGAQQQIARSIRRQEIEESVTSGEVIETYAEHRFGPACLILGRTAQGRPLHVLCSVRPVVDIITVYEPEPEEWDQDFRTRRR